MITEKNRIRAKNVVFTSIPSTLDEAAKDSIQPNVGESWEVCKRSDLVLEKVILERASKKVEATQRKF